MKKLKREIFDQWSKPEGPCGDCILRGFDVEPRYAIGNPNSRIVFIGWSPGEGRDRRKKWKNICRKPIEASYSNLRRFLSSYWDIADREGKGGKWRFALLFDRMLDPIDMTKRDVYFTNAVKCAVSKKSSVNGMGLLQCQRHLVRELDTLQPRLIVTFGPHALRAVLMNYGLTAGIEEKLTSKRLHGKNRWLQNRSVLLLSLLHWGNVNRRWSGVGVDSDITFSESCVKRFRLSARKAGYAVKPVGKIRK